MTVTTTAPTVRAHNEDLIGACQDLLRAGQPVNRKVMQERFGVSDGTVGRARRVAAARLKAEEAPRQRRRSPWSPNIDGQKLAERRFLYAKMNQTQLAEAVAEQIPNGKCSRVWIAKLEAGRGQPSVEMFRALCEVLHCEAEDLIHQDDV